MDLVLTFFLWNSVGKSRVAWRRRMRGGGVHKARGIGVFEKTNNIIGWKQALR